MNDLTPIRTARRPRPSVGTTVLNLSRRGFLGAATGALVLGVGLPVDPALAQSDGAGAIAPKPGTRVSAFLEIRPDDTVRLLSPFVEGGQGINTGLAQTIGEELDLEPVNDPNVPVNRRAGRPTATLSG